MALFAQTYCIILSAGSSVRMGTNKALLKFDANQTFIQKITETYLQAGIAQVIVVVNSELYKLITESNLALSEQVKLVVNDEPEQGRFYSLQIGVKFIPTGSYCFFQNIDNPFTTIELLDRLILHKNETDVIVPTYQNRAGHPVLINPQVVQKIKELCDYEIRVDMFLKQFTEKRIETQDQRILININSKEDYLMAGFIV